MHQALRIPEILLNIFGHLSPTGLRWTTQRQCSTAVLAALARTCLAFKEPALDVLWSELVDLTPLARCLPEACEGNSTTRYFSINKPLDETEWNTLRSYTRRVWHIYVHAIPHAWLDNATLLVICRPSDSEPLFPNLRRFFWQSALMIPAVHFIVPSLTSLILDLTFGHVSGLKDFLESVGVQSSCLNIKHFRIRIPHPHPYNEIIRGYIRRWRNLKLLDCHDVDLDADTIIRLSDMFLTHLSLTLSPDLNGWIPSSDSALAFPMLANLETRSESLEPLTRFLSCIRLPALGVLGVDFSRCPSKEMFRSCLTTVGTVCSPNKLADIKIHGMTSRITTHLAESGQQFTLSDLRPCMAFFNLRHVHINLQWRIDLTDSDLLALASSWPRIRTLLINPQWGWRTTGGITLSGLLRLLHVCRSLYTLCIAIHTDSFVRLAHERRMGVRLRLPSSPVQIDLADSFIGAADVPALVDAFVRLGPYLRCVAAWDGRDASIRQGAMGYRREWRRVFDGVAERCTNGPGTIVEGGND